MTTWLEAGDGERLELDERGYLVDAAAWTPAVAEAMARADGVELQPAHWQVIGILRRFHDDHGIEPPMRSLLRLLGEATGTRPGSRELYRLFPDGPIPQGCRYAGLPCPVSCL